MKRILTTMVMVILIASMFSTVYAATGKISVGANASTIEKGKSFTVTISATADAPIDGMYTKISYDTKVLKLEETKVADNYSNNSGTGEIYVANNSTTTSPKSATLCTMKFTVLDDVKATSTKISFEESELHLNNALVGVNVEDVEVEIKAKEQANTNTNKNNATTNTNKNNANTSNSTKLPQTGIEEVSVILVAAIGIVLIVSYVAYKRYTDIK